ncbi:SNF2-related protein [Gallibacterium anatis]|uniref:SNF2-related protein n=1 Tax=Gallibacterium anatis TaxID=750 RepID=UPI000530D4C8|nr:SNF2-related protein [Gallibacterium anatis]KGQ46275.1 hypothetical protein JP29_04050 [Gallibacterium anatis]MBP4132524.1 restriction endonuclease [Gallibacterium anatis]WAX72240.1 SNF2-related protein [Gallibacterium anatis]
MLTITLKDNYEKFVAKRLFDDGLVQSFDGKDTMVMTDEQVYHLLEEEDSVLDRFSLPEVFNGYLGIQMRGLPIQPSCQFLVTFVDERGRAMMGAKQSGCLLLLGNSKQYLLPRHFFDLLSLQQQLMHSYNEALCWKIIEIAKNDVSKKIIFKGLPENDVVTDVHYVSIDLQLHDDGSATPKPRIQNLSQQTQAVADVKLLNPDCLLLVISHVQDGHQIRYIAQKDVIMAYRRIQNIGTLSKENLIKFQENPIAFVLEEDESENDFPINFDSFRIIGAGEPYVGYFGSKNLDSPIAAALFSDDKQIKKQVSEKVNKVCQSASTEELETYIQRIQEAQQNHLAEVDFGGEKLYPVEYASALDLLEKMKKEEMIGGALYADAENDSSLVLQIQPNDEETFKFREKELEKLAAINTANDNPGDLFDHLAFPPKSYQVAGVNWLVDLYQQGFKGGILADDMGLGKTYQLISFIYFLLRRTEFQAEGKKRILIVAPTILLDNWQNEFAKFLPPEVHQKLVIQTLKAGHLSRIKREEHNQQGKYNTFDVDKFLSKNQDIIITSYETLANYQFAFVDERFNFGCIIFDEAHKIKNPNAKISQAARAIGSLIKFCVLLTGTPIENELRDLWALFDVFAPEHFGSWKSFREEFINVAEEGLDKKLRECCSNYLLRRLKKDYLGHELPQKIEKTYEVVFSGEEVAQYHQYRHSGLDAITKLHKLKSFSLHRQLANGEVSNIRLDDFSKSKKLIEVLEQIRQKQEKVIIFVMRRAAQDLLRYGLNQHFGLDIQIINGDNNKNAEHLLHRFRTSQGFDVIILSTLAAGVGLTLTEANHVIHYERWWNASKEDQASDRVYRIGQAKDVFIHHILGTMPNDEISIDKAIHQLISQKRTTAGFLIPPKSVSTNEVGTMVIPSLSLEEKLGLLEWTEFEKLVATLYRRLGYTVELTPSDSRDYGADVIAYKGSEKLAIQCKHSSNAQAKNQEAVYQLVTEAKDYYSPTHLIAICNTKFTKTTHTLAQQHGIQLIEKEGLIDLIEKTELSI